MDSEFPRSSESINSRVELIRQLKIDKLMNKNRQQDRPFRTMIEVITQHNLGNSGAHRKSRETVKQDGASKDICILEQIFKLQEDPRFNVIYNPSMKRYEIPLPLNLQDINKEHRHSSRSLSSNSKFTVNLLESHFDIRKNKLQRAESHPLLLQRNISVEGQQSYQ